MIEDQMLTPETTAADLTEVVSVEEQLPIEQESLVETPIVGFRSSWVINQLIRDAANGGVTTANWCVNAVDGEYNAVTYGSVNFTPDPNAPDFKPYESLTEADVLAWVWGSVDKVAVEESLEAKILAKKNPITLNGLPW